ncbi:MAG: glycosyltransferase, partial [Phycisphaeraceae bacterium]
MAIHGDALSVTWVNTIGTRPMRWSAADLRRAAGKVREFAGGIRTFASLRTGLRGSSDGVKVAEPCVVSPVMWPGFRNRVQRWVNAASMARSIQRAVGPRRAGVRRVVLTTLPIAADLPGRLDADRWVYMAVDDFSVWPGLDGEVMDTMERRLVARVDAAVAASDTLRDRLAGMGREAEVLTHGIYADHWRSPAAQTPGWFTLIHGPVVLFWGLIDARLDAAWCVRLARESGATLVLVGPTDGEPPAALREAGVVLPGPAAYGELPAIAGRSDVLVMPYVDAPVTRAMQPLKLKEYLATGRPVVARDLPATRPWADACDVVSSEADLLAAVRRRLSDGIDADQLAARRRLSEQTWRGKALRLSAILTGDEAASSNARPTHPYTSTSSASAGGSPSTPNPHPRAA